MTEESQHEPDESIQVIEKISKCNSHEIIIIEGEQKEKIQQPLPTEEDAKAALIGETSSASTELPKTTESSAEKEEKKEASVEPGEVKEEVAVDETEKTNEISQSNMTITVKEESNAAKATMDSGDAPYPCAESKRIKSLLNRTGYRLEITGGQRKYGGPPPNWEGPPGGPIGVGYEIYIGHIPLDIFEDIIIPLFEECGQIWEMRLMMEPKELRNRGYAFLTYFEKESASAAAQRFNNYEIMPGKYIKVNVSVANTRLFLGNIPKSRSKEEIIEALKTSAEGVADVILHTVPDATDRHKNRGFCFVDFVDHRSASDARRKISQRKIRPFNTDLVVDWAQTQDEPDEETMKRVKVLYVRNLKELVTETQLRDIFGAFGPLEKIKRIRDYAFVHFKDREACVKAMQEMNGQELEGITLDCSLAKPQTEDRRKRITMPTQRGRGADHGIGFPRGYGHRGFQGRGRGRGHHISSNFVYPSQYPRYGGAEYSGTSKAFQEPYPYGYYNPVHYTMVGRYDSARNDANYLTSDYDYNSYPGLGQAPPPPPPPVQTPAAIGGPSAGGPYAVGRGMPGLMPSMYGIDEYQPPGALPAALGTFRGGKRPAGQTPAGPTSKRGSGSSGNMELNMGNYGYTD